MVIRSTVDEFLACPMNKKGLNMLSVVIDVIFNPFSDCKLCFCGKRAAESDELSVFVEDNNMQISFSRE